jgi:HEAT repeat protein
MKDVFSKAEQQQWKERPRSYQPGLAGKEKIMGLVAVGSAYKDELRERLSCEELAADLEVSAAAARRHAAQEITSCLDAATALVSRVKREENTNVREAILNSLLRLHDPSIGIGLGDCLRSEDAALHNNIIETFKELGGEVAPILLSLLDDLDPDVRIYVVNILNSERRPDVEKCLIEVIEQDVHASVCAMAVDLLCEVGTEAAIEPLLHLKARFAHEAYIQFAANLTLKRIREFRSADEHVEVPASTRDHHQRRLVEVQQVVL